MINKVNSYLNVLLFPIKYYLLCYPRTAILFIIYSYVIEIKDLPRLSIYYI